MVVVDTSVWVDFVRGENNEESEALALLISTGQDVALTDLTYTELLQGVKSDAAAERLADDLQGFRIVRLGGLDDFESAAALYRATRTHGRSVRKTIDCLIAAVCMRLDAELLHRDVDFDRLAEVSNLRVFRLGV